MKFLKILSLVTALSLPVLAYAQEAKVIPVGAGGIGHFVRVSAKTPSVYSGTIAVRDGAPVAVSIKLEADPKSPSKMTGSFTVENEAGPFKFNKIAYDSASGITKYCYIRKQNINKPGYPKNYCDLSFYGKQSQNAIAGESVSGQFGPMGSFTLNLQANQKDLVVNEPVVSGSYSGKWKGGSEFRLALTDCKKINPLFGTPMCGAKQLNPPDMELDYSPGLSARLEGVQDISSIEIPSVYVDYFRHTVVMATHEYSVKVNADGDALSGRASSIYTGSKPFEAMKVGL